MSSLEKDFTLCKRRKQITCYQNKKINLTKWKEGNEIFFISNIITE